MTSINACRVILLLLVIIVTGVVASAECLPGDNNDTEATAIFIGPNDVATGSVCPDDPFDYYKVEIPNGAEVSGEILFSSPQASTVLRFYNSATGAKIIDDASTSDENKSLTFPFAKGDLAVGIYYFRIFHWSAAAFEHEYTLKFNATIKMPPKQGGGNVAVGQIMVPANPGDVMEFNPNLALFVAAPWPSPGGFSDNWRHGRSLGPGSGLVEIKNIDLYDKVLDWAGSNEGDVLQQLANIEKHLIKMGNKPEIEISDLRVSPTGRIYFYLSGGNLSGTFHAFDLEGGEVWYKKGLYASRLDMIGRIFYCEGGEYAKIYSYGNDKSELWNKALSGPGAGGKLLMVGSKVLTDNGYTGNPYDKTATSNVTAFSTVGDLLWTAGPFEFQFDAVAEDTSGNTYIRTLADKLYKVNNGGTIEWMFDVAKEKKTYASPDSEFGPIVGTDGRVWIASSVWNTGSPTPGGGGSGGLQLVIPNINGPTWYAFNPDGSFYKEGFYGTAEKIVRQVCYGSNGILNVAFYDGSISGYQDWGSLKWTWNPGGSDLLIQDMIEASNDILYVAFSGTDVQGNSGKGCYIAVVDSPTGNQLALIEVNISDEWIDEEVELAFSNNSTLLYLNHAGFLKVFGQSSGLGPEQFRNNGRGRAK